MKSAIKMKVGIEVERYASVWDVIADTPEEAANLRVRAELRHTIEGIVKDGGWTQTEPATRCGVTQPRMNDLLRGGRRGFRWMLW
jgi:predicted XRE-type DNA-binding protein